MLVAHRRAYNVDKVGLVKELLTDAISKPRDFLCDNFRNNFII